MKRYCTSSIPRANIGTNLRSVLRDTDVLAKKKKRKGITEGALKRAKELHKELDKIDNAQKAKSIARMERIKEGRKIVYVR